MFTIKLAQLLAGKREIDQQTANRLGTLHYFLNKYHPEQYKQFLRNLERYESGESIEQALQNYLKGCSVANQRRSCRIIVKKINEVDLRRKNSSEGLYPISIARNDGTIEELKFDRASSHFLFLLILLFAKERKSLKFDFLDIVNRLRREEFDVHPLVKLAEVVYPGDNNGKGNAKSLLCDHKDFYRKLKSLLSKTENQFKDLQCWFIPQNKIDEYVLPISFEDIKTPNDDTFKELTDAVIKAQTDLLEYEPIDYGGMAYDNSEIVERIHQKLFENEQVTSIPLRDWKKAAWDDGVIELLRHAAETDNKARNLLAQIDVSCFDGSSLNAFDYCKKSAEEGDAQGQFHYATYYLLGRNVEQDFGEAVHWLQLAAAQDHADATWLLGKCYFYGHGVPEDKAKAFEIYKQAADLGSTGAARDAVNCLMEGIGTERDVRQAYGYMMIAAEKDLIARDFCRMLMGGDYLVSLPEERIAMMEEMYHSDEWKELRFHFNPKTQVGEPRLEWLMHIFGRIRSNRLQEKILDLLDKFQYIPGEMHWIEHVNRALYPHIIAEHQPVLEIVDSDSEMLRYDVRFHLSNGSTMLLSSLFRRRFDAIITYMIVAAFSSRLERGFTTSYANGQYAEVCRELWMKFDNNASRHNVRRLLNEHILNYQRGNPNPGGPRNRNFGCNLGAVNKALKQYMGMDSMYFAVPVFKNGQLHYRRIPTGTEIILPQKIVDIMNRHHVGDGVRIVE